MRNIVIGVALLVTASAATAGFDFKGIAIGQSSDMKTIEERIGIACKTPQEGGLDCSGYTTVGGNKAFSMINVGSDGVVDSIMVTFDEETFDSVESEVISKFGKPNTNRRYVKSRAGVSALNVSHRWVSHDGCEIVFEKNFRKMGEAFLFMNTPRKVRLDNSKVKAKARDI